MNTRKDISIGRIFAIAAAMAYGVSQVLTRLGVTDFAPPLVGAAISLFSGTLVLATIGGKNPERNLRQKKRAVLFLMVAGVGSGLGVVTSFLALSMAQVVIVSPLLSTSPIFTLVLSHFFLRKLEGITRRLVLGTIIVVVGVTLVAIGRVI